MTNNQRVSSELLGIKKEMQEEWDKSVESAIGLEAGADRDAKIAVVKQISALLSGLRAGLHPQEVLKLVEPGTEFVRMPFLIQAIVVFSERGEEFRLWWNEWHDRIAPTDVPKIPVDEMGPDERADWDARPRQICNPWQVSINGRWTQLPGVFDPSEPLTKSPKYGEIVNATAKKIKELSANKV